MAALGRDGKPKKPNRFAHKTNQKGEAKREREREREREKREERMRSLSHWKKKRRGALALFELLDLS
jgi:hypothetical protein